MSTPYMRVVTIDAAKDVCYPIDFPSDVALTKVTVTGAKNNGYKFDLYSRAFTREAKNLVQIQDVGGAAGLVFAEKHLLKEGDTFTVASNGVGGYNTTHVVVTVVDDYHVISDQVGAATGKGGTATLAIPSDQQPLYEIIPQQTGSSGVARWAEPHGVPFVNQDPRTPHGAERKVYIKFDTEDVYHVALTSITDWTI
jgi:hypothetical protein